LVRDVKVVVKRDGGRKAGVGESRGQVMKRNCIERSKRGRCMSVDSHGDATRKEGGGRAGKGSNIDHDIEQ
jgi:hypothetical protein